MEACKYCAYSSAHLHLKKLKSQLEKMAMLTSPSSSIPSRFQSTNALTDLLYLKSYHGRIREVRYIIAHVNFKQRRNSSIERTLVPKEY